MTSPTHAASADVPTRDVRVRALLPADHRRSGLMPVVSLVLHLLVIFFLIRVSLERAEERGEIANALQAAGGGGGGGTGGAEYVILQAPPPPPAPPEAVEVPVVVPTVVPPEEPETELRPEFPVAVPDSIPAAGSGSAGTGGGSGGGEGTGQGPGQGSGVGPGSGGGSGGGVGGGGRRGSPPESRLFIIPPLDQPKSLRGKTVEVTFHIDARGRVTALEVVPPIADRGYRRKFDEAMREYEFKPARDPDGRAVAGIYIATVTFSEN